MSDAPVIVWFRRDLRLADNPALTYASKTGKTILFIYIHSPMEDGEWTQGAASQWWLNESLGRLAKDIESLGGKLHYFIGPTQEILTPIAVECKATKIVCSRIYEPVLFERDKKLTQILAKNEISLEFTQGNLLFAPGTIRNKQGNSYKVFTAFYKACLAQGIPDKVHPSPKIVCSSARPPNTVPLEKLGLLPPINWYESFSQYWTPGESGAQNQLAHFIESDLAQYLTARDFPSHDGVSLLSPYLHFGELSIHRIIYTLHETRSRHPKATKPIDGYIRQIMWREFSHAILFAFPHTSDRPFLPKFDRFPWRRSNNKFEIAWQRGQTGIPIVDAGMRELWHTGFMHNRVRMLTASLLTKNAMLHWKRGAKWFWDTLVDADLAQNSMGWQWVAGCGVDAAPYFRIFNPVLQGKKFDPEGTYVKRWVPELEKMPSKYIHAPWLATDVVLETADVQLGKTYPLPILDLSQTRSEALALFKELRA